MLIRNLKNELVEFPNELAALILASPLHGDDEMIFDVDDVNLQVHFVFSLHYDESLCYADNLAEINEVAVIGRKDETWGEAVTLFTVLKKGENLTFLQLKDWCKDKMSPYKTPKSMHIIDALPRNAMGKVVKPLLKETS